MCRPASVFTCLLVAGMVVSDPITAQDAAQVPPLNAAYAFRSASSPQSSLTLATCVKRALAQGFDLKIEEQNLLIVRDTLPIANSEFEPRVGASASKGVLRSGQSPDSSLANVRSDELLTRVGVSQRVRTGADLSLSLGLNRSSTDPSLDALDPTYGSDVAINIRQPLLRGFGTRINMLPIRGAEIGIDVAERTYEEQALAVIENTERAYYLLAGAREQLLVFNTGLELAQALLKEASGRRAAGMATHIDVLQAEVGVANARLSVIDAEKAVLDAGDALLGLMGQFEFDAPLGSTILRTETKGTPPSVESSYQLAREHSPALRAARATVDLAEIDVSAAKDDLKPFVALDVALGLSGTDDRRRGAIDRAFSADGNLWQAGLSVTFPLGRSAEKARWRQTTAALTRETLRTQQLEQNILMQVREAVRSIEANRERVEIAALATQLGERQYDAERQRFKAGLSTSRRVLEAQTDLENARVAHLQTRLGLLTARAALQRVEGSALSHYGVTLPDPAFSGKTAN